MSYEKVCGVKVLTWGTHPQAGNGMIHFLDNKLFGGNVGHASIQITIPQNQEGEEIAKYCKENNVPCIAETIKINSPGKNDQSELKEIKVYRVYWSWWPSKDKTFALKHNPSVDALAEREGVHFEYDKRWGGYLNPEKRRSKGKLTSKNITLAPESILHQRHLSDEQFKLLDVVRQIGGLKDRLEALKLLDKKLQGIKIEKNGKKIHLGLTEKNIIGRYMPDYLQRMENQETLSETVKEELLTESRKAKELELKNILDQMKNIKEPSPPDVADLETIFNVIKELNKGLNNEKTLNSAGLDLEGVIENLVATDEIKALLNKETLDQDDIKKLYDIMIDEYALEAEIQVKSLLVTNDIGQQISYDNTFEKDNVSKGTASEGVVRLPIRGIGDYEGDTQGLNAKSMIEKMVALTKDGKNFDLITKNCSKTTDAILEAGAVEDYQKKFFQNKAFGYFGNPQEAMNNALRFEQALQNGKPSVFRNILEYNPLERMAGFLIGILLDDKKAGIQKAGASFALILVSPFALTGFIFRKVLNPLQTFKDAIGLINYGLSKKSFSLKATLIVLFAPITVLAAIPALMQFVVKKGIVDPIKSLKEPTADMKKAADLSIELMQVENLSKKQQKNYEKSKEMTDKIKENINNLIIDLKENDPKKAIILFKSVLDANSKVIPRFEKKTLERINKFLSANSKDAQDLKPLYESASSDVMQRIAKVQKVVREGKSIKLSSSEKTKLSFMTKPKKFVGIKRTSKVQPMDGEEPLTPSPNHRTSPRRGG